MNRQMRYSEVKGVRFNLTKENLEDEIVLSDPYECVTVEDLGGIASNNIAVYINNAKDDEYVLFSNKLKVEEIEVNKVKVKVLNYIADYKVQITLMR